jgi:DNA-binding MurR/RpiR family transcriptional regulator
LIDLEGGNFAELLVSGKDQSCLVIFEARRYSRMARLLASKARKAGIPTTLVTDAFCDWGRDLVDEMFVVPTEFNLFWESTAQMASLANLLVNGVFIELGPAVEERMNEVSRLYSRFTGYVGDPSGPSVGHQK